jgi:electron transfer flavoprotein alpha subunit
MDKDQNETFMTSNEDSDASIFSMTDFGIVRDIFAVLPEVIAEVRRMLDSR